jgi:rare lipoprotein A
MKKTQTREIVLMEGMDSGRRALLSLPGVVLLAACGRRRKVRAQIPPLVGAAESGVASWYGNPYHGRRAANGEIYDMEKLTAAHRTLPFGAWVEVENLENGKKVKVRITDRGPFVEGRIIDLSRAAAREIAMLGPGIVKVRLEVIESPQSTGELFAVQIGAFANRDNSERLEQKLKSRYPHCRLVRRENVAAPWRVLVGEEPTPEAAAALARELRKEFGSAFVVRLDETGPDRL